MISYIIVYTLEFLQISLSMNRDLHHSQALLARHLLHLRLIHLKSCFTKPQCKSSDEEQSQQDVTIHWPNQPYHEFLYADAVQLSIEKQDNQIPKPIL